MECVGWTSTRVYSRWAFYITLRLYLFSEFHAEAPQTTASEGLVQGPYVAARAGFEPTPLRRKASNLPMSHHTQRNLVSECMHDSPLSRRRIFSPTVYSLYSRVDYRSCSGGTEIYLHVEPYLSRVWDFNPRPPVRQSETLTNRQSSATSYCPVCVCVCVCP